MRVKSSSSRYLLSLIVVVLLASSTSAFADVTLIANPAIEKSELRLKEVRAIFTMKKRLWSDGQQVNVFVLKEDNPIHRDFCKKLLGLFPRQLDAIWDRLVFSGTGSAPVEVSSKQEMLQRVANTPGAIGYIDQNSEHNDVKTLTIYR